MDAPTLIGMLIAMVEHPKRVQYDLSSLRCANSGGAPVPPELLRRVQAGLGCDLLSVYGQTEASPIICQTAPHDAPADKAETAGQPLWQVEVRIADPVSGAIMPVGTDAVCSFVDSFRYCSCDALAISR